MTRRGDDTPGTHENINMIRLLVIFLSVVPQVVIPSATCHSERSEESGFQPHALGPAGLAAQPRSLVPRDDTPGARTVLGTTRTGRVDKRLKVYITTLFRRSCKHDRYKHNIIQSQSLPGHHRIRGRVARIRAVDTEDARTRRTAGVCHAHDPALERDGHIRSAGDAREPTFRWVSDPNGTAIDAWVRAKVNGTQITNTPVPDRPRERLLANGAASLRTAELLAILIRTGKTGESALQAGEKLANHFANHLDALPHAGRGEMNQITGAIGAAAYCQIMAGIELGRRVDAANAVQTTTTKLANSQDAIRFCQARFARLATDAKQEEFHIVTLDTKNQIIDTHQISVGTLDASLVHPREVFRAAIKDAASSVILVHNHPSGDPTPSKEDLAVTRRLEESGKTLGIDVLDHIVLATRECVSIREARGNN